MKYGNIYACPNVFIHRSIKTRIETVNLLLKAIKKWVFIHRSIKTRIETPNSAIIVK